MNTIKKTAAPSIAEVKIFLNEINFELPVGFIDFFDKANGAEISSGKSYVILWPITGMIKLNKDYHVHEYAPDFFIFGSDGGDTAYCFEIKTGLIYHMPFVGMANEEAIFINKTFEEFLLNI